MTVRRSPGGILLSAVVTIALLAGCDSGTQAEPTAMTAGYVVPWDPRSLRAAPGADVLSEISPVLYQPTGTGGVTFASTDAENSVGTISTRATRHGLAVMPTISNYRDGIWDGALVHRIVTDPTLRAGHVGAITNLVRTNGWSGIDLDYESLPAASRAAYAAFVSELAASLHGIGARLAVTVHAKTAEPGDWSGAQAQDWRALGTSADQVRVMAYDHAFATSAPGPIAPRPWVDQVLSFAAEQVPVHRLVLVLATYGYDWPTGGEGTSQQWADIKTIARNHDAREQWDAGSESPWLRYTDASGRSHTVWYEDSDSLSAKLAVAKRHGVNRLAVWRLGGEDPDIWQELSRAR